MKTIYFAHPYGTWETTEEAKIEDILKIRNYKPINAFNQVEYGLIEKFGGEYYANATTEFASEIVKRDLKLVGDCDEFFGWFPKGNMCIGSSIELYYAFSKNKPITVICDTPHPFLYDMASKYYISLENFEKDIEFKLPYHTK